YYKPGRRRLVVSRLPGVTGYTTDLLHRFPDGTRTVSPVAQHVLVTVLPLTTPPKWQAASVSPRPVMLPSPRIRGLGLRSPFSSVFSDLSTAVDWSESASSLERTGSGGRSPTSVSTGASLHSASLARGAARP